MIPALAFGQPYDFPFSSEIVPQDIGSFEVYLSAKTAQKQCG